MKRRTVKVLKWLGIVAVVMAVFHVILAISANRALDRAYAALEADGRPTSLEDVIPPGIPDADNAALVYRQVVIQFKAERAGEKSLWDALVEAERGLSDPPDAEAVERFRRLYHRPEVAPLLAKVEAGSRRPGYWNDLHYRKGLAMEIPHISELLALSRIICVEARLQSAYGDQTAAWDSALTALRIANALKHEPMLLGQFVRSQQLEMAADTIQSLPYSAVAHQKADALLGAGEDPAPWVAALDLEIVGFGEAAFGGSGSEREEVISLARGTANGEEKVSPFQWFLYTHIGPLSRLDRAAHIKLMHAFVREMSDPAFPKVAEPDLERRKKWPWYCVLTRMVAPVMSDAKVSRVEMISRSRVTRAGLAVLQHREEHGAFPESLPEMRDLADPFTGEPLIYQPSATGFVLYSVGENLVDDEGTAGKGDEGDIVWRYSAE